MYAILYSNGCIFSFTPHHQSSDKCILSVNNTFSGDNKTAILTISDASQIIARTSLGIQNYRPIVAENILKTLSSGFCDLN